MNGYYYLVTVFYGVEHTIDQMNLTHIAAFLG
jgi:hypothetical protein